MPAATSSWSRRALRDGPTHGGAKVSFRVTVDARGCSNPHGACTSSRSINRKGSASPAVRLSSSSARRSSIMAGAARRQQSAASAYVLVCLPAVAIGLRALQQRMRSAGASPTLKHTIHVPGIRYTASAEPGRGSPRRVTRSS